MISPCSRKVIQFSTFAGALLMAIVAHAVPIIDTIDQNVYVGWFSSYEYTHDLTEVNDDPFTLGTAESGSIAVSFSDDGDRFWEVILIQIDQFDLDTGGIIFSATSFYNELEVNALAQINETGLLDITIRSLAGDFYVGQSVLTVETASMPEPTILGIAGLGLLLLGMGAARRIRTVKVKQAKIALH
jgi:hypothetical protein